MKENTIAIIKEDQCFGCSACFNKCPRKAIKMEYNSEGFLFPKIQTNLCIQCGQCTEVCPVLHIKYRNEKEPDCYAVMADDEIRKKSSSGGMFTLLAEYILDQGGYVCGAVYSDDWMTVNHIIISDKSELYRLRGSKYVQSNINNTYLELKNLLKEGKYVLFTGCPCQVAGLYNFLGFDYPNLYTVDLVCHGANSVYAYQSFLKEEAKGRKIKKVDLRGKDIFGWTTATVIYYENGSDSRYYWDQSPFNKGFLNGIINRKSCADCPFANTKRIGDITLGDFWQVHKLNPEWNDNIGTSLVLVNTEKGKKIFNEIKSEMKLCEKASLDFAKQYNGQLRAPQKQADGRQFFFEHLKKDGYHAAIWYGQKYRYDFGLVGWWFASNYGSILTYYALGKILEDMNKLAILIRLPKNNHTPWEPQTQYSIDFLSRFFPVSKERSYEKMYECNQFCDAFMLGSDQLWISSAMETLGYSFFLDFVDISKKRIAYSTSFGHEKFNISSDQLKNVKYYLSLFDAISVRENTGIQLCKDKFGIAVERKLDPVFVCNRKHYDTLADNSKFKTKDRFLFCYILDPTEKKQQAISNVADRLGLKIIAITDLKNYETASKLWKIEGLLNKPSIETFLYCIKNCDFMVTDSHHGVCFALIYKKNFIAINNATRGSTRFTSLLTVFESLNKLVQNPEDINDNDALLEPMDWERIDNILQIETKDSKKWLYNAINSERKAIDFSQETTAYLLEKVQRLQREIGEIDYLKWKVYQLENKNPIEPSYSHNVGILKKLIKYFINIKK